MENSESTLKASRSSIKIVRSVLFALFMREMQTRFGARRLGLVWVVMEPLAILTVILTFYSLFRASPVQGMDFVMYMVSGIVPFHMMRNIAWRITDSLQANQGLFSYRQVMPFDAFVARVLVELCTYFCAYVIICFFLGVWFDHDVLVHDPLVWIGALMVGVLLSFSLGMIFAIIGHSFPNANVSRVLKLSYIPLYLTSGVFFPVWRMPAGKFYWVAWNPYMEVINTIRAGMFDSYPEEGRMGLGYPIVFTLITLFIGMALYRWRRQYLRVANP